MKTSNFIFLQKDYPLFAKIGMLAEANVFHDPTTTLFKIRLLGEKILESVFEEHYLDFPNPPSFHQNLIEIKNERVIPERVLDLFFTIKSKGNVATHQHVGTIDDAKSMLMAAFKISKWFYETYVQDGEDISDLKFSLPDQQAPTQKLTDLERDFKELEEKFNALLAQREIKAQAPAEREAILVRSETAAKKIGWTEEETRDLIDAQLAEAHWEVNTAVYNYKKNKTLPEKGRNRAIAEWPCGSGWADYALFIGLELYGLIEAKKFATDISTNLTQTKKYATSVKCIPGTKLLEHCGDFNVPFLFSTNGRPYLEQLKTKSGIWFLDGRNINNLSKPLRGWYSPDGLKNVYEHDLEIANKNLKEKDKSFLQNKNGLNLRDYQMKAIQAIENCLMTQPHRTRALLEMATGTGKTRTILGLCYRLISANRFKRILFLVDRTLLAKQTYDTFKDERIVDLNSFTKIYAVSELIERIPEAESRVHFATVQGLVKRLFYAGEGQEILPIDTYDCIIVDEAHRGYLQDLDMDDEELNFKDQRDYVSKYRMVLDYFDAFAIGLTATPALHTTEIFGKAVFTYSYREAVLDGYLIDYEPPYIIKTKLSEEGISWKVGEKPKVYDAENAEIVELDELEDELNIDVSGFNKTVLTESFNRTVVQQLVKELSINGQEKTLIFAATDKHADELVQILKEEFVKDGAEFPDDAILKITGQVYKPLEQVRCFKNEKYPNIVVTVDLLTTGVDVPAICNIVFMRRVKSRILFEQMLGRATRLCTDINKEIFRIYDAVGVYETLEDFTNMKPVAQNPKTSFTQLVEEMDSIPSEQRTKRQLEQIIAKFQRKKKMIGPENEDQFTYAAKGQAPEVFLNMLKTLPTGEIAATVREYPGVWKYLDGLKPIPRHTLVSDHEDAYVGTDRGYGKGQKPEDYLEGLKQYIEENKNKIAALQIVCTRPKDLDRKSLKALKLELDLAGYNSQSLNTAWRQLKNQDVAADIVSYIRTLAIGSSLISHEQRIRNAVSQVRGAQNWSNKQIMWLNRFEIQLLNEEILKSEDLDEEPFKGEGGFKSLNKIFDNKLQDILEQINENLYSA